MSTESVLDHCVPLVARWEGFEPMPYFDSVGVRTLGHGFTDNVSEWEAILADAPLTKAESVRWLRRILRREYLPHVRKITGLSAPWKLAGYTSFSYNVGVHALRTSTLADFLQEGKEEAAEEELLRWVYADGEVLEGLVARRKAEKRKVELDEDLPPAAFDVEPVAARKVEPIDTKEAKSWERYIGKRINSLA